MITLTITAATIMIKTAENTGTNLEPVLPTRPMPIRSLSRVAGIEKQKMNIKII